MLPLGHRGELLNLSSLAHECGISVWQLLTGYLYLEA